MLRKLAAVFAALSVILCTPMISPAQAAAYRTHTASVSVTTSNTTVTFTDNGSGGDGLPLTARSVTVFNQGPAAVYVDCKDGTATTADTVVPVGTNVAFTHDERTGVQGFSSCGLITSAGTATALVFASAPGVIGVITGGITAGASSDILPGDVELEATAATAASANNVTLAGAAGKTTYISGFTVTGGGATAASNISITITGLTNTLNFVLVIPAGATVSVQPLIVEFARPIPASAVNTAIVVNVPSFGAGNTAAAVTARGFQR